MPFTEHSEKFQSTLPRGERHHMDRIDDICKYFNPRSREGSDHPRRTFCREFTDFNPRSREGSDRCRRFVVKYPWISIHAPARGATQDQYYPIFLLLFQSTLPRGERPQLLPNIKANFYKKLTVPLSFTSFLT